MSIKKYRSVEGMPGPPALQPLDPENFRRLFEVIELASRLHPKRVTPGVRKFRSVRALYEHRISRERSSPRG